MFIVLGYLLYLAYLKTLSFLVLLLTKLATSGFYYRRTMLKPLFRRVVGHYLGRETKPWLMKQ